MAHSESPRSPSVELSGPAETMLWSGSRHWGRGGSQSDPTGAVFDDKEDEDDEDDEDDQDGDEDYHGDPDDDDDEADDDDDDDEDTDGGRHAEREGKHGVYSDDDDEEDDDGETAKAPSEGKGRVRVQPPDTVENDGGAQRGTRKFRLKKITRMIPAGKVFDRQGWAGVPSVEVCQNCSEKGLNCRTREPVELTLGRAPKKCFDCGRLKIPCSRKMFMPNSLGRVD